MIHILLVDDDPNIQQVSRLFLEKNGEISVETAGSAEDALRILGELKFDGIVSDYEMPGMDGIEFLKLLRGRGDRTPFIILSGRGREHVILEALNSGADFFIQKGVDAAAQYAELKHKLLLAIRDRAIEDALRESESRYRGVVEDQTEFICRFRPDGTLTFANDAFFKYYGKSSDMIGTRFIAHIPLVEQARIRTHLNSLNAGHPFGTIEHRTIMDNGDVQWQQWSDRVITDSQGRVIEYQSVGRDITDRVRAEEKLKKYSEHLEELVEERTRKLKEAGRFAAIGETATMVGHDLRNPLQVIVNALYLGKIRIEQMSPEEHAVITKYRLDEILARVEDQSVYMNKIVLDLQDYARPVDVNPGVFPLRAFIEEVLGAVDRPGEISVKIDVIPSLEILADRHLMKRVFSNLLTNAFQSIEGPGGVVVSARQDAGSVIIGIKDTGIGMDETELLKVFSPLYTTKPKGTGLGLNVSKRLVNEQGGSLVLQSRKGEGTTAIITLPVERRRPSGTPGNNRD
jgi:PAS domain S-box-containing protein